MPAKRKRGGSDDDTTKGLVVREDDPLPAKLKQALKSTLVCDVWSLTSQWLDAVNHDLDANHV